MEVSRNKMIGSLGEDIACRFLVKKGFSIVEKNYRKKWGEIDIIASKDAAIHFIEVKAVSRVFNKEGMNSSVTDSGFIPEENIHPWKIKRLSRTINSYLSKSAYAGKKEQEWQIDAVIVFIDQDSKKARIKFIESIS